MTERDSIKANVSATSVGVEVEGQLAKSVTTALIDLLSPFTNAAGFLGDQLSYARRLAAIRAAAKAAEQLKQEGISNSEIPPKILLPWLEGASLETDENDNLTQEWAGLFVRAAKSSDAVTVSYIETLKKLGKEEASLLHFFAGDTSPTYSEKFYQRADVSIFSDLNPLRYRALEKMERILKKPNAESELAEFIENWGIQGMCQIIFYSLSSEFPKSTIFFRKNEHVISNLEHLGLIRIHDKRISLSDKFIDITWFQITKYAFDLMWACDGVLTGSGGRRKDESQK